MTTLIIATRNAHKAEEIRAILGPSFHLVTLRDFPDAPAVVEDANTFAGNATKKAVELARWLSVQGSRGEVQLSLRSGAPRPAAGLSAQGSGLGVQGTAFVLADDSGLEVDALKGAPGIHSARFAALEAGQPQGNSSDAENNAKLLRLLKDVPAEKRSARFHCVIALTPVLPVERTNSSPACAADEHELQTELFDGRCEGQIRFSPTGANGFGYDPLFVPDGFNESFAELGEEVKNRISHRARALEKLRARFAR